jgi:hypothetical protein
MGRLTCWPGTEVDLASCSSYISTPVYVVFKQLSLIIVILLRIENSLFRGYYLKNSSMDVVECSSL